MKNLYTYADTELSTDDLQKMLSTLGIASGDTLFIHSDIMVFGKLSIPDKGQFLTALIDVFKRSVGPEGTVIMPTFTYSWGRGESFDVLRSRSQVGSLSEFFRMQSGVRRSIQPMHSVAAWGKHADAVCAVGKDTFGEGSVFEHLRKLDAKIVMFGVDFEYCTFLIHVEQMHKVPYRSIKTFRGTIVDGNKTYEDAYTYFARPLDGGVDNDMRKIEPYLRENRLLAEATFGNGRISVIRARDVYDAGMHLLDEHPDALLANTPGPGTD